MGKEKILKECDYKSLEWASTPVILESMFREYDLRNPMKPLEKGGLPIAAGINNDGLRVLGQAYGTYVQKKLDVKKIVVGNDYRSYSRGAAFSFITGVLSTGVDVIDIGTQLSPVLYFAQYHFKLEGGAMITASHNDNGWSGIKLAKGLSKTLGPDDILEYKKLTYSGDFLKGKGSYEHIENFKDIYCKDITDQVKGSIGKRKLKVVLSGGNGGACPFLTDIFENLGFEVIQINNEPDWNFPHFNPNPENLEFAHAIGDKVKAVNADLGIGVDGDGDRFGLINEKGEEVFSDRAGLLIARYFIEDSKKKDQSIIIDVKSTGAYRLDPVLKEYDSKVIFTKTGHSYVKAATQEHDAIAGFEKSGHFFLRGKYGRGYDDAMLSGAWVATILSNSDLKLSELIGQQVKSYQSPTIEPSTTDDVVKYEIVEKVIKHFEKLKKEGKKFAGLEIEELITINGMRFILEGGAWGLIRASSNLPHLVLTCESFRKRKEMYDIIEAIQEHLKEYDGLGEYDQQLPPYPGEDDEK